MKKLTDEQIRDGLDKAYKEAGENAYFSNGFLAGIDFAQQQGKLFDLADVVQQRELLIAFKTWEVENDIKNLKPDQLANFYLEDSNL